MDRWTHNLGILVQGSVVSIEFTGGPCKVWLLEHGEDNRFRRGSTFRRSAGGAFHTSPVQITVPNTGQWHLGLEAAHGSVQFGPVMLATG